MNYISLIHLLVIPEPGDVFFAASDIGWVVGYSYTVYGPLLHGCTTILYEGKPVGKPGELVHLWSHFAPIFA